MLVIYYDFLLKERALIIFKILKKIQDLRHKTEICPNKKPSEKSEGFYLLS